jgi:hypothetical protein
MADEMPRPEAFEATHDDTSSTVNPPSEASHDIEKGCEPPSAGSNDETEKAIVQPPEQSDLVDWDGEDDPQNPMNWSNTRKYLIIALVSTITFVTYGLQIQIFPLLLEANLSVKIFRIYHLRTGSSFVDERIWLYEQCAFFICRIRIHCGLLRGAFGTFASQRALRTQSRLPCIQCLFSHLLHSLCG